LVRTVWGKNGVRVLEVYGDDAACELKVRVVGAHPGEREELEQTVRRMFALDVDLSPFYGMDFDPVMERVVHERKGMRIVREPNVYECLVKTIISQQLNVSFAAVLIDRLIRLVGEVTEWNGELLPVFPKPEQVARLSYEELQALQFNRRKAEYVIDLSRKVADGTLDLEELDFLPDEEVFWVLLPQRGIGRWTVECLLLFGLGRPDLLPAADIGLRNAIRRAYGLDQQPDENRVRRMGEAWAPFRSFATFYLWDTLSS
jgi:DNA-3-methyladenine glycosylase II